MGPQATIDFERRVHRVSQDLIPQWAATGYPPMVVYYHRNAPFVLEDDYHPVIPFQPHPDLERGTKLLGSIADFIVITSNGPHMLAGHIEETAGVPLLSMIECTLEEVRRRSWRRVGVLGLGEPLVYMNSLEQMGLSFETLSDEAGGLRDLLDQGILALMSGQETPEHRAILVEAIEELRGRSVDGIILGCTELPLLLADPNDLANGPDLINPAQLLAEAAVRRAME
jgi:aspartate racemase